jgi:hypothetical protein
MLYIYTVASDPHKARHLLNTAAIHELPIHILEISNWTGFIDKILTIQRTIEPLQDQDIVCFLDAYDVLAMANTEEILYKFLQSGRNILMSSELNCYPVENQERYDLVEYRLFEKEYDQGIWDTPQSKRIRTNYKYMNSGGYIGYVHALKRMFQWKTETEMRDIIELGGDQNFFTQYYLEFANNDTINVGLDSTQTIFQNLYKVDLKDFAFFKGRLYNHCLKTYPCFVHFNGFRDYGGCLVNTVDGSRKDAMEVFVEEITKSCEMGNRGLEWRLPEFWYGGQRVGTIPQYNTKDIV